MARTIAFDRWKYGAPASVDAAPAAALPGFIQSDEPHRLAFHELVFVTGGGSGWLEQDGTEHELRPATAFLTCPGQVRCWHLQRPLDAVVVLFEADLLDAGSAAELLPEAEDATSPSLDPATSEQVQAIVGALGDELRTSRPLRDHALRAGLCQLLVALQRAAPRPARSTSRTLVRAFTRLVDQRVRDRLSVADYARMLGVSAGHLGRRTRAELGASAGEIVARRGLVEAKRLLRASDRTVTEIARELGHDDVAYFVRWFRRSTGTTPQRFRKSHSRS